MPHLAALRAENFRCFDRLSCALDPGTTVFIGDNAQGKTSVLEAVCVLLRLHSPRTSSLADLAKFGQVGGFGISGDLQLNSAPPSALRLSTDTATLKLRWIDGRRFLSTSDHDDLAPSRYLTQSTLLVWMGNDDLTLVRGTGEGRRKFLDFLGTQAFPAYRPALQAYDKALRSRNRLLKEDRPDAREIAAYTTLLIQHGNTLTRLRAELVEELIPWAADAHHDISGSATESLRPRYISGATDDFTAALHATTAEESRRRLTVAGPHRDDLALSLNDHPANSFASEGQQRTIALALKLAQARLLEALHRHPPLLLLDDIFGELDPRRRNALLHALPHGSQQLITTTHLSWVAHDFRPSRLYHVEGGSILSTGNRP